MGLRNRDTDRLDAFYQVLKGADETYSNLPLQMKLLIEKISLGLPEFGPRKLGRAGLGTEFREARDFMPDVDEPRAINARLSVKAGKPIVVDREAEIRQHVYLWRDATPSMDFASKNAPYTKKQAAEIMLLAFARHLARNEEMIGILDGKGMYRGGKAHEFVAGQVLDVSVVAGNMPSVGRKLPRNSTVVLFSDFMMENPDDLINSLDQITGVGLKGYLVMVLDPQELDFRYRGHTEFKGMEGEGSHRLKKAESRRDAYQEAIKAHMEWVENICAAKGFKFILQRTDRPLQEGLLAIYGLTPQSPARGPAPGL